MVIFIEGKFMVVENLKQCAKISQCRERQCPPKIKDCDHWINRRQNSTKYLYIPASLRLFKHYYLPVKSLPTQLSTNRYA